MWIFFQGFCLSWLDSPCQNWHFLGKGADLYKDIVLSLLNLCGGVNIFMLSCLLEAQKFIILGDYNFDNVT